MPIKIDIKGISSSIANFAQEAGKAATGAAKTAGEEIAKTAETIDVKRVTSQATALVKSGTDKASEMATKIMDVNGDGQVDIEDVIIMGLQIPGIGISRDDFLRAELIKDFPRETIEDAVKYNPAHAGITPKQIEKYAEEVIKYERNCVSGISAALGMPGGAAMAATIPADIAQYYGYMLRVAQKLLYLYGFPQIDITEKGKKFDTETLNILTLCMGVMYGVAGASNAIKSVAKALGNGVQKQLMKKALTKGTIYPIVKSISKWFGVRMTKEVFTGFFKHAIPVVGGVIGGGLTYVSFKPCCDKLKASLEDTLLSNPDHASTEEEDIIIDTVELEEIEHDQEP